MSTPSNFTPFFNLILPTVGGSAVDWSTWTNQNWTAVDSALQTLTSGKLSLNPSNSVLYGRRNNEWVAIDVSGGTVTVGIGDAPNDGNPYLRQSLGWIGAEAVIQGVVDASVEQELSSILRRSDFSLGEVLGGDELDIIDEAISHDDLRDANIRLRWSGSFLASTGAEGNAVTFTLTFGGVTLFESEYRSDSLPLGIRIPFLLDYELSDFAGAQVGTGVFTIMDQDAEEAAEGKGGLSKAGSNAPANLQGTVFTRAIAVDLTGTGTKDLVLNIDNTSTGGLRVFSNFVSIRREAG